MKRLVFTISLTIQGPLLSKSSAPGNYGLDVVMARNHNGKPILNNSHIVGKLRDSWRDLGFNQSGKYLGTESDSGTYLPNPKRLQFSDFIFDEQTTPDIRHRILIDPERKAVVKGAICFAENLFQAGGKYTFTGQCTCFSRSDEDEENIFKALNSGLRFIPQLGGERTVGLGRLLAVDICRETFLFTPPASTHLFADGLGLSIRPLSPFCFAKKQVTDNLFESSTIIPGAAIAGSVAILWRQMMGTQDKPKNGPFDTHFDTARPDLGKYFDELRFFNALPGLCSTKRAVQWPHSLVKETDSTLWDVAPYPAPILIRQDAPAFSVDWKESEDVSMMFGWVEPERELRVRTKIDRKKRRAKDGELFAYEMIVPEDIPWHSRIVFPESVPEEDRPKVSDQLASLLCHGLFGLGKTKAEAKVEIVNADALKDVHGSRQQLSEGETCYLTLQSSAILCDPETLNEQSGGEELQQAYNKAWEDLSGGVLKLSHFFASQTLAGGRYLWTRFQRGKKYTPWLLTEAGSVFALIPVDGREVEAIPLLQRWSKQGLDLPDWAKKRYGDHWSTCPFLPQHGFGECRVDLDIHQDKLLGRDNLQHVKRIEELVQEAKTNG